MNIREIAKKAGVSVATVSRVLNHPDAVAKNTKDKIEKIIAEEEYTPNWFARSLNFNRTGSIGLMIPHILNPVYMEMAKGVEDVAYQKGYITFMCNAENDREKEKAYLAQMIRRRVDGIVMISSTLEKEDYDRVKEKNIPVVLVGGNKSNPGFSCVRIDCEAAAKEATKHMIDIGYRKVAMFCSKTDTFDNRDKIVGYREAFKEAGVKIREEYIKRIDDTVEDGYLAAKKMVEKKGGPHAIFATSDNMAFGVMDAVKDQGLRIPEDVAVIGFDNIKLSNLVEPKLSTVDVPLHKMGVYGARLLLDIIEDGNSETRDIILQTKLKIRKSCGHKERIGEMF
ncbi:MAG: LacI family DNA-binding transcriptional regulator [Eubacteriaceae bacterium]|nr:LacI family DNA-binding transcriptional regulator [Eubacteriaceae bacterium]